MVRKVYWALLLTVISAAALSCNRRDPNIPKVNAGIRKFNERFNAGLFHDIYANADPRFQQSISEETFAQKLESLLEEHGPIMSTGINGVEYMSRWQRLFSESKPIRFLGVYSHCRNGGFQELFQFDITGEEAKLVSFETSIEDANRNLQHKN